ncbi:hypothetical protein ACRRTK_019538 [Alexandromys fortis]
MFPVWLLPLPCCLCFPWCERYFEGKEVLKFCTSVTTLSSSKCEMKFIFGVVKTFSPVFI